jgi:uncharacterized protein with HEPN domain
MPLDARKYLFDIRRACGLLEQFTAGKTFADYGSDPLLRSAVERQFEIVGEALGKLAKVDPEAAATITDHRRIIAFRNVLIHGYDAVSDELVWGIVESKLAVLKTEVDALLGDEDGAEAGPD